MQLGWSREKYVLCVIFRAVEQFVIRVTPRRAETWARVIKKERRNHEKICRSHPFCLSSPRYCRAGLREILSRNIVQFSLNSTPRPTLLPPAAIICTSQPLAAPLTDTSRPVSSGVLSFYTVM